MPRTSELVFGKFSMLANDVENDFVGRRNRPLHADSRHVVTSALSSGQIDATCESLSNVRCVHSDGAVLCFHMKTTLAGIGAAAAVLGLYIFSWPLNGLELALYDQNFEWFWREQSAPQNIIIVSIDEPSLRTFGEFPWPRSVHAQVIDRLSDGGAKAVSVDLGFFNPDRFDPANDEELIRATREAGNVVFPTVFDRVVDGGATSFRAYELIPSLADAAAGVGHAHLEEGCDDVIRSLHLAYTLEGETMWNINVELVKAYLGITDEQMSSPASRTLRIADVDIPVQGSTRHRNAPDAPLSLDYEMYIGFVGAELEHVSAQDVIEGRSPPDLFENKIAFYGGTASELGDGHTTPLGRLPGVVMQANVVTAILERRFLRRGGSAVVVLATLLGAWSIGVVCDRLGLKHSRWTAFALVIATIASYLAAFNVLGYWFGLTPIVSGFVMAYVASTLVSRNAPPRTNASR